MASFAGRMRQGLLWLERRRRFLHAAAWLTFAATVVVSCSGITQGRGRDWTFRYLPEDFLFHAGLILLACGVAGSMGFAFARRRWSALAAAAPGAAIVALAVPSLSPFDDGALSRVCLEGGGCIVLSTAPVYTDTVYDLWHEPESDSLIWRRFVAEKGLNYSEDGSFTESPRLLLSGNERILVLERGGIYADAIDLHLRRIVSGSVLWSPPDYHERIRANSRRIEAILAENR